MGFRPLSWRGGTCRDVGSTAATSLIGDKQESECILVAPGSWRFF